MVGHSQFKNEDELKKQANKYFEEEDYANGFKLYSQLVSNYHKDPAYNFRLGVCMLYTEPDKKKPIPYLSIAAKIPKGDEKEALFYLGKAYHFNYLFDEAINYYMQYKNIASASMIKKLQVDREIQACKNGKRLLSNIDELVVLDKKQVSEEDYFRSYDLKSIGGKLLVKPDEFRSAADKKKKDKSIIYLPKGNDQLYYAGYGEKSDNKDIYSVKKLPSGEWSKPESVGTPINTEFDEDYPFLHPNGTVLYFASKGHNSMGGYDLFKSELDTTNKKWKEPVNLEFPINSPNDDILFVTDSLEKVAFFSSDRQSPWGKTDVFKILTEKRPAEFAFISGTVLKKDPNQSLLSKIKVKNIETGEDAGTFAAKDDGTYSLKLPNGGKFIFTVETPGFPTQSEGVTIPTAYTYVPYKQVIGYENQKLYITNFFDVKGDDENNYKEYLALIAQKSKMDVNANDFGINPDNPLTTNNSQSTTSNKQLTNQENQVTDNNNQIKDNSNEIAIPGNNKVADTKNKNVSNKELIQMAYDDANELQQAADSLKENAKTAFSAANSKEDQANQKKQEAEQIQNKANIETDLAKKQDLISEANKQKYEAALLSIQSTTANNIAKQLEIDATNKQKEADLNLQYAKALEEAEKTKNNKQAIAKLEDLQKQLEEASKQKSNSNTLVEGIKVDANNKQQELQNAQTKQEKLDNDVKNITNEIGNLDKQISETNDKDLIDNLKSQKQEQEGDLVDIKREQEINKSKILSLKEEAEVLKSQADFAATVIGGNQIAENNNQSTTNNNQVTENNGQSAANNNPATENKQVVGNNNQTTSSNNQITENNAQSTINSNQVTENNNQSTTNNNPVTENNAPQSTINNNQVTGNNNQSAANNNPVTENSNQVVENNNQTTTNNNQITDSNTNNQNKTNETTNNNQSNTSQTSDAQQQVDELNKQANDLSAQARQIRKDAKTLTGTDKQNAINKIAELEKQSTDLHYKAAKQQIDSDRNAFTNNQQSIQDLLKNPENKENTERVKQLTEEADILNKAAQELKEEAESDPSIDSRVGGLSNADEKQKTALAKQQEALKLLKADNNQSNNQLTNNTANQQENNNGTQTQNETNNTNTVASNTIAPVSNETQNESNNSKTQQGNNNNTNQIQNETNNDTVINNTVTTANNELQNNQIQNTTNNTVTNNTNETTNNQKTNNQTQNTADNINAASNNTVTPANNQTTSNLSPEQVNAVKNSPEYKQYTNLQQETKKYNEEAIKEQNQAELYQNKSAEFLKRAEQLKSDANSLPDGTDKQAKLQQADVLEVSGNTLKEKADSMMELASSAQGIADSKKQEADTYSESLDEKTYNNILAVNSNKVIAPVSNENKLASNEGNQNNVGNNVATNNTENVNRTQGGSEAQKYIGTKGFEIKQANAYNKARPIPINEKLPEGLVFRVQIGAFKNPIPTDQFKGLAPVGGETTPQGFIRYQAGLFDKYNNANAVKNDLKKLGYKDAFVVAYLNGKRINLAEALASLQQKGEPINTDANATAGITANSNVPVNNTQPANTVGETQPVQSGNINTVNGLLYTIQIGVYTNNVSNGLLKNLKPIYREKMDNGNYRYTAGIYSNLDLVKTDRRKVNAIGIPDAFVSAYLNGQKIKITDAIEKANNDKTIQFPPQQPIIFPNETTATEPVNNTPPQPENNTTQNNATAVQPFSNGVTEGPAPTADNGVKANDDGITFKVQIGAFHNQVPQQIAETWLKVKTWPVKYIQANDLYLYTVGSFTEARFAQKLRGDVINLGITDAFITVFKDGKKLYGAEAQKYLNR